MTSRCRPSFGSVPPACPQSPRVVAAHGGRGADGALVLRQSVGRLDEHLQVVVCGPVGSGVRRDGYRHTPDAQRPDGERPDRPHRCGAPHGTRHDMVATGAGSGSHILPTSSPRPSCCEPAPSARAVGPFLVGLLARTGVEATCARSRQIRGDPPSAPPLHQPARPDRTRPRARNRLPERSPCPALSRADDGIRTRDPNLGKVVLYQLSHVRVSQRR